MAKDAKNLCPLCGTDGNEIGPDVFKCPKCGKKFGTPKKAK